jgi:rod shape-determining protein MreD
MIHHVIRSAIYFVLFVLIQVVFLNQIYFLRIATPFLYIYFLLKLPVTTFRLQMFILFFLTGLVIDAFSNTPGMHAATCTMIGFVREPLIRFFMGKELPTGTYPSYQTFGYGGFIRYTVSIVFIHHVVLFLIESMSLFDFWFLLVRIIASVTMTSLLVCTVELFNPEARKNGGK